MAAWPAISRRTEPTGVFRGWSAGTGPLRDRLARHLRRAIADGALAAADRLPSERALAAALGVSRTTVEATYTALLAEGLLVRRHGSGTWVAGAPPEHAARSDAAVAELFGRWLHQGEGGAIDLSLSTPADPSHLPLADLGLATLLAGAGHGYDAAGSPGLRRLLAARLGAQGLATTPDDLLVTTGAQQAISLVAGALLAPGDVVAVEDPTYPGALATFVRAGLRPVALATDGAGATPQSVAQAVRAGARAVFVVPTHHNPGGWVMPAGRRAAIVQAGGPGTLVVEDLTLAELWLDQPPPAPMAARPGATVVSVGSLSKLLWGGLRVGWVRAPAPVLGRLARAKRAHDLAAPLLDQRVGELLLAEGDGWIAAWRAELARRRDVLSIALREAVPEWSWTPPAGGLSLWVEVGGADGDALAAAARRHGVAVAPGGVAQPGGGRSPRVRISFAPPTATLEEAARRLGRAWAAFRRGSASPSAGPEGPDL